MCHYFHPLTKNSGYSNLDDYSEKISKIFEKKNFYIMQSVAPGSKDQDPSAKALAQAAITAALTSNWKEAVSINEKILLKTKDDVEALNRLARAYSCMGEIQKAQKTYKKVLEIDPYNIIALKNMDKISKTNGALQNTNGHLITNSNSQTNLSSVFLYEPGKTKIVSLLNLAPASQLATLNCGDKLEINPKNHSISVSTQSGVYLGAFPDDLAHRLISLIGGGNQYEAYIKCVTPKILTIFIREVVRSPKFINQPSFQTQNSNFFDEREVA